jgi:hypothetical protein
MLTNTMPRLYNNPTEHAPNHPLRVAEHNDSQQQHDEQEETKRISVMVNSIELYGTFKLSQTVANIREWLEAQMYVWL